MSRIHVGLNFEYYSRKSRLVRLHMTLQGTARAGWRGKTYQGIQHFAHTEVINGRTEKYRGLAAGEKRVLVEFGRSAAYQFDFLLQIRGLVSKTVGQQRIIQAFDDFIFIVQPV